MARTPRGKAAAAQQRAANAAPAPRTPTLEDFATVPQLAEVPLVIPQLTFPDGSPFEIRVRALSARERAACERAAIKAAAERKDGSTFDEHVWAIERAFYALVSPRLTPAQKDQLWDWNPHVIDAIVGCSSRLEKLPARAVELEVERLAGVTVPDAPGTPAPDHAG
jgi:hypothetical protein